MSFRKSLLAIGLLAGGCAAATSYPAPPDGVPAATLTFSKGDEAGLSYMAAQVYSLSETGRCANKKRAARLLWMTPANLTVRTAAGSRITVFAATTYYYTKGTETVDQTVMPITGTKDCSSAASFVAEAGHSYRVTQIAPFQGSCRTDVTDAASGQPPATLQADNATDCDAAKDE